VGGSSRENSITGIEVIDGGAGTNIVAGTAFSETIDLSGVTLQNISKVAGDSGNDTIIGTAGDDTIDGGADTDIVRFQGNVADYSFTHTSDTITVTDTVADRDGSDTLTNVETLRFADQDLRSADILASPLTANFRFSAEEGGFTQNTGGEIEDRAELLGDARIDNGLLVLDGEGDYLRIESSSDIDLANVTQRTASFWFKTEQAEGTMVLYEEGGTESGMNITVENGQLKAGAFNQDEEGGADNWLSAVSADGSPVNVADGQWHHVAVSLDGEAEDGTSLTGYLDGENFGQTEGVALGAHPDGTGIGGVQGSTLLEDGGVADGGLFFKGEIDDARFYATALDESAVRDLYENPPDGVQSELEATPEALEEGEETELLGGGNRRSAVLAALPDDLELLSGVTGIDQLSLQSDALGLETASVTDEAMGQGLHRSVGTDLAGQETGAETALAPQVMPEDLATPQADGDALSSDSFALTGIDGMTLPSAAVSGAEIQGRAEVDQDEGREHGRRQDHGEHRSDRHDESGGHRSAETRETAEPRDNSGERQAEERAREEAREEEEREEQEAAEEREAETARQAEEQSMSRSGAQPEQGASSSASGVSSGAGETAPATAEQAASAGTEAPTDKPPQLEGDRLGIDESAAEANRADDSEKQDAKKDGKTTEHDAAKDTDKYVVSDGNGSGASSNGDLDKYVVSDGNGKDAKENGGTTTEEVPAMDDKAGDTTGRDAGAQAEDEAQAAASEAGLGAEDAVPPPEEAQEPPSASQDQPHAA